MKQLLQLQKLLDKQSPIYFHTAYNLSLFSHFPHFVMRGSLNNQETTLRLKRHHRIGRPQILGVDASVGKLFFVFNFLGQGTVKLTIFVCTALVNFNTGVGLCICHHNQDTERFHPPTGLPGIPPLSSHPSPQVPANTDLFSITAVLSFEEGCENEIIQQVTY